MEAELVNLQTLVFYGLLFLAWAAGFSKGGQR